MFYRHDISRQGNVTLGEAGNGSKKYNIKNKRAFTLV